MYVLEVTSPWGCSFRMSGLAYDTVIGRGIMARRTIAEITMIKRKTTVEENNILKEIRRNAIREKEVVQALKKEGWPNLGKKTEWST